MASSQQKVLASHPDDTGTPELCLVRLDRDTFEVALLRWAALRHRVTPGQRRFVTEAVHTLPRADTDPYRTPFAVVLADIEVHDRVTALEACVGFGILDRLGILRDLTQTPESSVLLRAYYITPEWQGKGIGRAACSARLLHPLISEIAPELTEVVLCVNDDNEAGLRTYRAAGFVFTGVRHDGPQGSQQVMSRPVRTGRLPAPCPSEAR